MVAASASRRSSTSARSAWRRLSSAETALHALDHVVRVLPGALARRDLVGRLVLGRAAGLDLGQQLAAAGVELEELVEVRARAAALERCSRRARVARGSRAGRARAARPYSPSAPACCSSDWISLVPPGFGGRSTSVPE